MTPPSARSAMVQISTNEYKIGPLKKAARALLGYPHPHRVPPNVYAEQAIGISTDEFARAKDADVRYLRNVFPLIDMGWTRSDCERYLADRGFGTTVKSACIGCPFHGNKNWRWLRDNDPDGWNDAVDFDRAIRGGHSHATNQGQPLRGQYYLHRSCVPLAEADLDPPTRRHRFAVIDENDPEGCSPWSCRSGTSADQQYVPQDVSSARMSRQPALIPPTQESVTCNPQGEQP